jgi:hypothetical protein
MAGGQLNISIAGLRAGFVFTGDSFLERARRRYAAFRCGGEPELRFAVRLAAGRPRPFRPVLEEEAGRLRLWRGDFDCRLDLRSGRGELLAAPRLQAFDSFLRALYSRLLPPRGVLLVHGASLVYKGRAWLFPGVSGAGKSTLSRLALRVPGVKLLSDELSLCGLRGGRWQAWGSPFWGEMRPGRESGHYPLAGGLALGKARRDRLLPQAEGRLLRLLLRCCLNFSRNPRQAGLLLGLAGGLAAGKNRGRLLFSKAGPGFLDLL